MRCATTTSFWITLSGLVLAGPALTEDRTAGSTFRDCADCPEMVVVSSGSFRMGSPETEPGHRSDEGPVREVVIPQPFAIGKFEVTRGQFLAFADETGHDPEGCEVFAAEGWQFDPERSWRDPSFEQGPEHPAVCISFEDARAYVDWLAERTQQPYRLPTEAEWEYAARAGAETRFFFGVDAASLCQYANTADRASAERFPDWTWASDCDDGFPLSAPAGSYQPNHFGLYDVTGNAWEWVEDCYHPTYDGAPSDGTAWSGEGCEAYVVRGGGLFDSADVVRLAIRYGSRPDSRTFETGLRVARPLSATE